MILIILFLGLILRVVAINQSLWLDEAIGAIAARDFSYKEIVLSFVSIDNHPPLYYLLLKTWTSIFGFSEFALRSLSVIFSIFTIYIAFLISRKIFRGKLTPLVVSIFIATSQFHIYFSQEARMYSMAAFFASLSILSFFHLLGKKADQKYWLIFSIANLLLIATDYMPIFLFPAYVIIGLFRKVDRKWWKKALISTGPILIFAFLWSPIFFRQISGYKWLIVDERLGNFINGGANIKELVLIWMKFTLGRVNHYDKTMYYGLVALTSIPFVFLFVRALMKFKKYSLIFLLFFVPLTFAFIASFIFPAFTYFRFLYLYPVFVLILGLGFENIKSISIKITLVLLICFINFMSWVYYINNQSQQRENWREAVGFVERKVGINEAVLFSFPDPFAPYRWYEKYPEKSLGSTDSIRATPFETKNLTTKHLEGKTGVYYFEYLSEVSDPDLIVKTSIQENGFENVSTFGDFNGVGFIYYFKRL